MKIRLFSGMELFRDLSGKQDADGGSAGKAGGVDACGIEKAGRVRGFSQNEISLLLAGAQAGKGGDRHV